MRGRMAASSTQGATSSDNAAQKGVAPPDATNPTDESISTGRKRLRPRAPNGLAVTTALPPSGAIQTTQRAVKKRTDENNAQVGEDDASERCVAPECSESGTGLDSDRDIDIEDPLFDGELIVIDGIPERVLSSADQEEQLRTLRSNWDFAVALDFFEVFEKQLNLKTFFTINQLEEALLLSQGTAPSLLCDLHMELLKGVCPSTTVTEENWQCVLARRVFAAFYCTPELNPFRRVQLASAPGLYAGLTAQDRALLLRTLCELRCDREDLRNVIDLAQKSEAQQMRILAKKKERGSRRKRKIVSVSEEETFDLDDFNRGAWGEDAEEQQYWLYDLGSQAGFRMCCETLPSAKDLLLPTDAPAAKGNGKKQCLGGASVRNDVEAGAWKTIATCTEDIIAVGEKLMKSKEREDLRLGKDLVEDLAVELRERALADERRSKALERQRRQLEMLVNAGRDRQMRERKQVKYTYEHVYYNMDRVTKKSARESRFGSKPQTNAPSGAPLRRGRSAGPTAGAPHELLNADTMNSEADAAGAASAYCSPDGNGADMEMPARDSAAPSGVTDSQHIAPKQLPGTSACAASQAMSERGGSEGVEISSDDEPSANTLQADASIHHGSKQATGEKPQSNSVPPAAHNTREPDSAEPGSHDAAAKAAVATHHPDSELTTVASANNDANGCAAAGAVEHAAANGDCSLDKSAPCAEVLRATADVPLTPQLCAWRA